MFLTRGAALSGARLVFPCSFYSRFGGIELTSASHCYCRCPVQHRSTQQMQFPLEPTYRGVNALLRAGHSDQNVTPCESWCNRYLQDSFASAKMLGFIIASAPGGGGLTAGVCSLLSPPPPKNPQNKQKPPQVINHFQ